MELRIRYAPLWVEWSEFDINFFISSVFTRTWSAHFLNHRWIQHLKRMFPRTRILRWFHRLLNLIFSLLSAAVCICVRAGVCSLIFLLLLSIFLPRFLRFSDSMSQHLVRKGFTFYEYLQFCDMQLECNIDWSSKPCAEHKFHRSTGSVTR